jgi:hypothetical protein
VTELSNKADFIREEKMPGKRPVTEVDVNYYLVAFVRSQSRIIDKTCCPSIKLTTIYGAKNSAN